MSIPIHQVSYPEILTRLDQIMYRNYRAFKLETNPGWRLLQDHGPDPAIESLYQYCFLPANIQAFLENARRRMNEAGWDSVVKKLDFNISQETGSHNGQFKPLINDAALFQKIQKKSHYFILIYTLNQDFGINFNSREPSFATTQFLKKITDAICRATPAFVGGVVFGLEHTAVPELHVLFKIIQGIYKAKFGKELQSDLTKAFFDLHVDYFECQHDYDLKASLAEFINDQVAKLDFYHGFILVLECMDQWWESFCDKALAAAGAS